MTDRACGCVRNIGGTLWSYDFVTDRTHDGNGAGHHSELTDDERASVREKRAQGVSLGALAKEYGVGRSAIQRAERAAMA
ncbi:hypothetical protein GCM10011371_34960 [Novosphingobium marinum]|nr:hypothetical protein GCM10011371_34960 [Novosphingobium marinum]